MFVCLKDFLFLRFKVVRHVSEGAERCVFLYVLAVREGRSERGGFRDSKQKKPQRHVVPIRKRS